MLNDILDYRAGKLHHEVREYAYDATDTFVALERCLQIAEFQRANRHMDITANGWIRQAFGVCCSHEDFADSNGDTEQVHLAGDSSGSGRAQRSFTGNRKETGH